MECKDFWVAKGATVTWLVCFLSWVGSLLSTGSELVEHWLPVQAKIGYRLSTNCHNFFSDSSPAEWVSTLLDLLSVCTPSRQPCFAADTWILYIPHIVTKTFGQTFLLLCSKEMEFSYHKKYILYKNTYTVNFCFFTLHITPLWAISVLHFINRNHTYKMLC